MIEPSSLTSRAKIVVLWGLRIALALLFAASGIMKLTSQPMAIGEFAAIGLGQGFRYFTGVLELTGGALILVPRFSMVGALLLLLVDIGAFVAQLTILHMGWMHPIVIGALLLSSLVLRRNVGASAQVA